MNTKKQRRPKLRSWVAALLILPLSSAHADWVVLNHNADTLSSLARCVLAPRTDHNRMRISRIRLTRSGTADVTHRFAYKVTEDAQENTESLAGCTPPTCRYLMTVEGAKEGSIYDLGGRDLLLPPGGRLYVAEDSHQTGEHVTIEVFYSES